MKILPGSIGFDWDKGNINKNIEKHNVTDQEAEEVFVNEPKLILEDEKHSTTEKRYMLWGTTCQDRRLTLIFTLRDKKIRVISARDMNRKERKVYEKRI